VRVCVLFLLLGISFSPIMFTAWWHLIHGGRIECAGRSIPVPLRWFGKADGRKAYIIKVSPSVFSRNSALISLWPMPSPPKNDAERAATYQSFAAGYWTYLAGGACKSIGPIKKGVGESEAICMETSVNKEKWISVSCLVFRGTWYGTYAGNPNELASFYKVIADSK
jgi:hypothetical protein